jgi:hypothetical protein
VQFTRGSEGFGAALGAAGSDASRQLFSTQGAFGAVVAPSRSMCRSVAPTMVALSTHCTQRNWLWCSIPAMRLTLRSVGFACSVA